MRINEKIDGKLTINCGSVNVLSTYKTKDIFPLSI